MRQVVGFQGFTSQSLASAQACSTALLANKQLGITANAALFSVGGSTGAVRFRDDGTAPTASVGHRVPAGLLPFLYQGDLHKIQFIVDTVAGNADLNVTYLSIGPGEQ